MIIDWINTEVTGISGIRIEMPNEAKISIFTDNDLTHITDDHFEINLIACLLDQVYVVPSPQSPLWYDDALHVICMSKLKINNGLYWTYIYIGIMSCLLYIYIYIYIYLCIRSKILLAAFCKAHCVFLTIFHLYVAPQWSWGDRSDTDHSKCLLLGGRRLNLLTVIPKPKGSGGARAATAQIGPANERNKTK